MNSISFQIEQGEFVGFIGPNVAGKTTTLKMLTGILFPTDGAVEVLGFRPYKKQNAYLKQIAFITAQKTQLWWDLPVIEQTEG